MKLYISRSLKVSIAIIHAIKSTFTNKGYQVRYYKSGTYTRNLLAESKVCVLSTFNNSLYVGKGQFSEVQWCLKFDKPCYHLIDGELYEIKDILELQNDWKTQYGKLIVKSESISLEEFYQKHRVINRNLLLL